MYNFKNRVRGSQMKAMCFAAFFTVISMAGYSQSLGINTTNSPPNPSAGADITFSSQGLLIPRVALTSTGSFAPLLSHVAGMLVYNTATVADVTPGFYQDDGTRWNARSIAGQSPGDMLYWNGTAWTQIPAGLAGQYLQINSSGIPAWSTQTLATVTTDNATSITSISAVSGGNITANGGSPIVAYGICWSTSTGPTTNLPTKTIHAGGGLGPFVCDMLELTSGTTYYVRAYATNLVGTAYGNEVSFSTP
jgi:hypothetical protein